MRYTIIIFLLISKFTVFGQNAKVEYDEIIPKYILAVWENDGTSTNLEFQVAELEQIKSFFKELSKKENQIISTKFLKKPSDNTLVAHYLSTKLRWNALNEMVGLKKLTNKKAIKKIIKELPKRYELLAFYYSSIFIDVLNKEKPMDLAHVNINLEQLNLNNDTEKTILFLTAMRHVGSQVTSYSSVKFPNNCFRAKAYVENMPKFNGQQFYEFKLPEFQDFKMEVDKRYPKVSFKKGYIPEFEQAIIGYKKCQAHEKN